MKYSFIYLAFTMMSFAHAQNASSNDDKNEVTVKNYRKFLPFKQKINALKPNYALFDACMQFEVNEQRAKHHLPELPWHKALETAAYFHSKSMSQYQYFSHYNNLDINRQSAESRGKLAGIKNALMAECIAQSSFNKTTYLEMCDEFINLWMNSAPHRKIILSTNANTIGLGFYMNENTDIYATLDAQCYKILVYDVSTIEDILPFKSWFDSIKE